MSNVTAALKADPELKHLSVTRAPVLYRHNEFRPDTFIVEPAVVVKYEIDRTWFSFKKETFTAHLNGYNGPTLPQHFDGEAQAVAAVLKMVRSIFVDKHYPMDPQHICPEESLDLRYDESDFW